MSPSPDSLTRTLIVHAAAPSAEIFVLDRTGRVLAKGVESITAEKLPIGIHKVRIRIGQRVMDTLVELPPGEGPHTAYVKDLPLESPVPEAGSADANALAQAGATSRQ